MNVLMLGDLAFTGLISEEPEQNIKRFIEVAPILNSADLVFANLEVPVKAGESKNEYKSLIHYSLPEPTNDLLKFLNVTCVSLANNHVFDCGMPGLVATINILDELDIFHTGAGWLPEHVEPAMITTNNIRIAFFAYVDDSTNPETEHFPELLINNFEIERVISDIKAVRSLVDKIIISIHWGKDYSNFYTKEQQDLARKLIFAGADIIMGHHPHTIQPYEWFNDKLIFYSLGQLCFGDMLWEGTLRALRIKTKVGMIAEVSIEGDCLSPHIIPTLEKTGNFITIPPLNLERKIHILRCINKKIHKNRIFEFIFRIGY